MATTITAGNSTNGAAAIAPDNTGILELKTGSGAGTTALTIDTGQQVAVTLGSAAAPAITFSGDTNTGIYSPGADRIGFTEGGTQVGEFDASGNFLFNSGYGSVAIAYGCRAWVNFNGTANTNLSGTYSQSGTTVTVTATAHGLIAGSSIYSDITTGTGVDGTYTVATVTDANTFTYTAGTSLTTSGNITLIRSTIRASRNVSSVADNATGDYSVNFSVAMPDANYSVCGLATAESTGLGSVTIKFGTTPAAGSVTIRTVGNTTYYDAVVVCVSIFR
jgi:hypothetical protein